MTRPETPSRDPRRFDHRDAAMAEPVQDPVLGTLPRWDFSGLYAGDAEAAIEADFAWSEAEAKALAADCQGELAGFSGDALAQAIQRYEALEERLSRILSFISLRYQQKTTDPERKKAYGDAQTRATDLTAPIVFFTLELNRIEDAALEAKLAESAALRRYKPWIDQERSFRPHQLSDELERYLHDASAAGSGAWVRLFDETVSGLRFTVTRPDGTIETLALEQTLNLMLSPDRAARRSGAEALAPVFKDNLPLFARIMNTLVKRKEIDDRWRRFETPQASRHLSNQVSGDVVQALRDAVVAAYPRLSHRYYAWKAKQLGLDQLEYWDRNAPIAGHDERKIAFERARDTVLEAYGGFAPEMAEIAQRFFANNWIDAPATEGKSTGAFAHPTVPSAHPFVMLNYLGSQRDVMTLAHELGHGVHQVLAAEQGELLSRTPLTLAETASVFGEMLTFKKLLAAETDPARKKALLAGKVDDMINTVVRQIAFYEFESRVHAARREGELTEADLCDIWMSVQGESLGPAIRFAEGYEAYWVYVGHFIFAPFYVYAYAFGDGLVNALYAVYEDARAAGDASFQEKYFDMLRAGGTLGHKELLAPFGLDASDPAFWSKGLDVISGFIDELEAMD
ncbi:MAG: M3 family oligoendopeptidase [Pseudomonadota bacterium]